MNQDIYQVQFLLERITGLLRNERRQLLAEYGLQPVQFEALNYLAHCNRYSDTPMAVTEYLGQTKGTVSQTLKVLETKGLIVKQGDSKDKRVSHLKLTEAGSEILDTQQLSPQLAQLESQLLNDCYQPLQNLLTSMQQANQSRPFGQCRQCRHNTELAQGQYLCELTKEPLQEQETLLLCREFERP
ncbi:MarR family winged helix-turn-helix transcriptional regulator [Shewanella corallii]|uniref:MarR family winged helix-turn-helix transcriptional regulator n=1 Tax=Shewanella corallii TaxID=560080 RepID=A0ABT0N1I1_9GAMM|nr:MarR family winged helix-turn-helix transcriptional regulator [Shewanella corallii]MCL2912291.1 MarR family winged helix-turn-helix transcriptional regulator [Shewanella corallii]